MRKARDEWHKDKMERLDFINERLYQRNKSKSYMDNVDEAMVEYYQILMKRIKPLRPKP